MNEKIEKSAKVEALQEPMNKASGDAKTKIQDRVGELNADHEERMDKLKRSWERAGEALSA